MLSTEQKVALRLAIIAGATDCVLSPSEAATFVNVSESYLRESDCPRSDLGGPKYLKSTLMHWARLRESHQLVQGVA